MPTILGSGLCERARLANIDCCTEARSFHSPDCAMKWKPKWPRFRFVERQRMVLDVQ